MQTMSWQNIADEPLEITQSMYGRYLYRPYTISHLSCHAADQTLPDHLPPITTLRILFTRFLDFNAVPRRTFFQYLRYFTEDELEMEKLDEFLSLAGAVRTPLISFMSSQLILPDRMNSTNIVTGFVERYTRSLANSDMSRFPKNTFSTFSPHFVQESSQ